MYYLVELEQGIEGNFKPTLLAFKTKQEIKEYFLLEEKNQIDICEYYLFEGKRYNINFKEYEVLKDIEIKEDNNDNSWAIPKIQTAWCEG